MKQKKERKKWKGLKNGFLLVGFIALLIASSQTVRAEEISAAGTSIFKHDPKGKVAEAYRVLTKEVLDNAEKKRKHQLEQLR